MRIQVRVFGLFRDLNRNHEIMPLTLKDSAQLSDVKEAVFNKITKNGKTKLIKRAFLDHCAFANEVEILDSHAKIVPNSVISILPPVCGG